MRFLSIVAVAVIGAAILAACNSTDKLGSNSRTSGSAPTPADGIRRVTVTELQGMISKNEVFVVDVRSEDSYNTGHIRGSKSIPLTDIDKRSGELPKDKLIVTYCS